VKSIQCLIANIPQKILAEIVQNLLEADGDIEVLNHAMSIEDLPQVVDQQKITLLIVGMKTFDLPTVCEELLLRYSNLVILGMVEDGRKVAAYFNDVASQDLTNLVNLLIKR
jgi:hypothetical protein